MLTIVVPMAELGRRLASAGYRVPEPLIPLSGRPMIELVIGTIRPAMPHRFVFVCQRADVAAYHLRRRLRDWRSEMVVRRARRPGYWSPTLLAALLSDHVALLLPLGWLERSAGDDRSDDVQSERVGALAGKRRRLLEVGYGDDWRCKISTHRRLILP